uniref:ATP synthase complex subunit 8 n=1 Tax=Rhyzopertha dominica TaxID=92692 RepID=A0A4P8D2K0_RHYDO|nr:ATP synthase F0 subunit 8 [Rhyzopertha dominica]QCI56359.1 ATP synthase F0 subunit 8 [Rhyzopertha dominica]
MPQMSPLNWTTLFIFFTITLVIMSTMNFYNYKPEPLKGEKTISMSKKNWKW